VNVVRISAQYGSHGTAICKEQPFAEQTVRFEVEGSCGEGGTVTISSDEGSCDIELKAMPIA
jgi:hypothetical protein